MLNRLYGWYGKSVVFSVFGTLVLLVLVGVIVRGQMHDETITSIETKKPVVVLKEAGSFESESTFSVVGTVRALSEVSLQTEAGGRVTSVHVHVGDFVSAGTVIATIENNQERASLLQAEGAYESALASAEGGAQTLEEARVGVHNAYRSAYSTVDGIIQSTIDDYFSNPEGPIIGYRLGEGDAVRMNAERLELERIRVAWQTNVASTLENINEEELIGTAEENVRRINDFTSLLYSELLKESVNGVFADESYQSELVGARTALDGVLSQLSLARRAYTQSLVSGASNDTSESSARLKSALGALRFAQTNYEKTLVRTPISGVVNTLYLVLGTYVSPGEPAAIVANNGSLEVTTALGESDIDTVRVGDTVKLDGNISGVITRIAPAIDPISGKVEIKIAVDSSTMLKNGSTVSVVFTRSTKEEGELNAIRIPLSSLKLLPSGPVVFTVDTNGALESLPVTLGAIMGDVVLVQSGISSDTRIVMDARGLRANDAVEIISE